MDKKYVILVPHADDELIGCFNLLHRRQVHTLVAYDHTVARELEPVAAEYDCFIRVLSNNLVFEPKQILVAPDPNTEFHPRHKKMGNIALGYFEAGMIVEFYTTNMNAPYLQETELKTLKRAKLNRFYPTKSTLWQYDFKYFLFEGRCRWLKVD